jgi:hypothetical protein
VRPTKILKLDFLFFLKFEEDMRKMNIICERVANWIVQECWWWFFQPIFLK